jgi:two-component system NarL family response regulator
MRIVIADDNRLLQEGLTSLLTAHGHEVVATASDGLEAIARTREQRPDLVLMDVVMPRCDGLAATRLIKAQMPETRIVMLTISASDEDLFEAIRSGASGFLLKSVSGEELMESLAHLEDGLPPLAPGLAAKLLQEFARRSPVDAASAEAGRDVDAHRPGDPSGHPVAHRLTDRQREVLRLVAAGLTYKEVGSRLSLSERTVRYHMSEIMDRLHLEHRSQVIAFAGESGLLDPSSD